MNNYTQQPLFDIEQENEKLRLENAQLKKSLEKEEFLHKTLYRQWTELNLRTLTEKRELKQVESVNLFYEHVLYFMLFLVVPICIFLSNSKKDDSITPASQSVSSPTLLPNEIPANPDSLQVINTRLEEKINQSDAIQPKQSAINRPVIDEPLSDSIRNSVYWEGWSAYYEKSRNPYQKSLQKSKAWLEGWNQGENDAKRK